MDNKIKRGRPKGGIRVYLADIKAMRSQTPPVSLQKIGDKYGVSRQRIHQLLSEQAE